MATPPAVLEVRNLSVRFGDHRAVHEVSLSVDHGEIVGLIGPNGAGKTTTFNAIAGVQRCRGTVHLDGTDISSATPQRRAKLGMNRTFQRLEVFGSMTAYDNVRTAAEIAARARNQSMKPAVATADQIVDVLGLTEVTSHRADALPTGRARLVELGRALATDPKVLLLDEPASGLDDVETRRLASVLEDLRDQGLAVLLVEHDIDLVMSLCSRIYVLHLGELIAQGTPAEIREDPYVREAYLGAEVWSLPDRRAVAVALLVACLATGFASCTSDERTGEEPDDVTTTTVDRPSGPSAELAGPLEGGDGIALVTAGGGPSLTDAGYTDEEYTASGTATSYTSATDPLPADGKFELRPDTEAEYTTRVIVRRPQDPDAFNGTVVVEWLNVTAGADSGPGYTYLAEELVRGGYAWVGVSAQHIGIEGGRVSVAPDVEGAGLGRGLKANDPERYGSLNHPGDAFAYDIFTQVARAVRAPGSLDPFEDLDVREVLAIGQSQSAAALTTYVNGVQPLTEMFDGFLVHSRFVGTLPLGQPGVATDVVSAITAPPTLLRTDGRAPVLVVETETDVMSFIGYIRARQPDDERFRLWEIAGTAHADKFQAGDGEALFKCPTPINRGQQVFVVRAAVRHLAAWVSEGSAPPEAERLEVDESGSSPALVLDDVGNARGGVRTPVLDAPVDVLSGLTQPDVPILCLLSGSTTPLDDEQLRQLYESPDDYLAQYRAASDAMILAGFALEDDREQLLAGADPGRLAG